jgi:hypothetical protein
MIFSATKSTMQLMKYNSFRDAVGALRVVGAKADPLREKVPG